MDSMKTLLAFLPDLSCALSTSDQRWQILFSDWLEILNTVLWLVNIAGDLPLLLGWETDQWGHGQWSSCGAPWPRLGCRSVSGILASDWSDLLLLFSDWSELLLLFSDWSTLIKTLFDWSELWILFSDWTNFLLLSSDWSILQVNVQILTTRDCQQSSLRLCSGTSKPNRILRSSWPWYSVGGIYEPGDQLYYSFNDTTGYGFHGDFFNGWQVIPASHWLIQTNAELWLAVRRVWLMTFWRAAGPQLSMECISVMFTRYNWVKMTFIAK